MHLLITPMAEQDLEAIGDYIATDSPQRALSFVQELRRRFDRLARNPLHYRRRPELREQIRSCTYGRYAIFFTVNSKAVTIVRVLHGARDLPKMFQS